MIDTAIAVRVKFHRLLLYVSDFSWILHFIKRDGTRSPSLHTPMNHMDVFMRRNKTPEGLKQDRVDPIPDLRCQPEVWKVCDRFRSGEPDRHIPQLVNEAHCDTDIGVRVVLSSNEGVSIRRFRGDKIEVNREVRNVLRNIPLFLKERIDKPR